MIRGLTFSLCFFASGALAQDITEREGFIINNVLHILHHEAGHAVIDQFALPVIGQEEDAADSFATLEVLDLYDDPFLMLLDSAEANFLMQEQIDLEDNSNYFDSHDLDIQRAFRIVCVAVGTDEEKYGEIADWAELPGERQESCQDDADLAWQSWDAFRAGIHSDDNAPEPDIALEYGPEGAFGEERALLEKFQVMTDFRSYLAEEFAWPGPLKLIAEQCGEANAFYDPEGSEIILCYEMVSFLSELEAARN